MPTDRTVLGIFPASDEFPLGRPFGRADVPAGVPSGVRPFGLTLAVAPKSISTLDVEAIGYDYAHQVCTFVRDGVPVRMDRHTDGQTSTRTNADGHQGNDSDSDQRED